MDKNLMKLHRIKKYVDYNIKAEENELKNYCHCNVSARLYVWKEIKKIIEED